MSLPVFLCDAVAAASVGDELVLDGDEGRHAATVMRIRPGEQLVLTDGAGTSATGRVVEAGKARLTVGIDDVTLTERDLPQVTVVQAIPKGDRGELAVEMLTEVGVDRIVPWAAARSVAVWRGDRAAKSLARWRAAARTATKQSRRSWLPAVDEPAGTADVVALLRDADLGVVLHEEGTVPLDTLSLDGVRSVVVVVGPEGGLDGEELAAFASAHVVRLGASVLRTSTAGVAAVAALLSRTPRWG